MQHKEFPSQLTADGSISHGIFKNLEGEKNLVVPEPQSDFLIAWELGWEQVDPMRTHIFVMGEAPFLQDIAEDRVQRYKIPESHRFYLVKHGVKGFSGFRVSEKEIFTELGERDRLEIVGQLVGGGLIAFFRFEGGWNCELLDPAALASFLQRAGISKVGTIYLAISRMGVSDFLPSFARELVYRGIQCKVLCAPEGLVYSCDQRAKVAQQKLRLFCKEKIFPVIPTDSAMDQKAISDVVPVLREGGPEFEYEVIVQVGEDPAIVEAAQVFIRSSPYRTCLVKWFPSQGSWQVLYGEPRFLRLNTRWVIVAKSVASKPDAPRDLFGELDSQAFALNFLRFLHAFETWQEVHGKFSHLLLVGEDLFQLEDQKSGFASELAQELAALGWYIQIRARGFVHQKDMAGCLYAGLLVSGSPSLQWTSDLAWERDLNWVMGELAVVDAQACELESPLRKPPLPSLTHIAEQASLAHLAWGSGSVTAVQWRARIRQVAEAALLEQGSYCSSNLVPIFEAAILSEVSNLLWMDMESGHIFGKGECSPCLREFETYFQNLAKDLFAGFEVDGDFRLQKRVGVSLETYETASRAAIALFLLTRSEKKDNIDNGFAIRLCSEFFKNLGENASDEEGLLIRVWHGASKNYANAELAVMRLESATFSALSLVDLSDKYEIARAYQFSAHCIQASPPSLCWKDFVDTASSPKKLLGNACECLSEQDVSSTLECKQKDVEEYFEKLVDTAQKNAIGTFQKTPEGMLWAPSPLAVVTEVDLRTPWICFGTHSLYSSSHVGGKDEVMEEGGMPFVQIDHATQLPFPSWSKVLSLDLWGFLGGVSREPLPLRPDILVLPVLPYAHISYEWGPCGSVPYFSQESALRKLAETGKFHALYRELGNWHAVQKLDFNPQATSIDIYLDSSTQQVIFPETRLKSYISYKIRGGGSTHRCLVRKGFTAEILCGGESENWIFESLDGTSLQITEKGIEGEDIAIKFTGLAPRKVAICRASIELSRRIELPPERENTEKAFSPNSHGLPGKLVGAFGNLEIRFDSQGRWLRAFCSKTHQFLGLLKTIYAQTFRRFDRIGVHDGCCYAVEYLLSAQQYPLQLTYCLNSAGWVLAVVSTDDISFFTALKAAQQMKCPLDELLLQLLDPKDTLWGETEEEEEENGILPHLADFVLVAPLSNLSLSSLWVRTADNTVIGQGKCIPSTAIGSGQMLLTTLVGEEMRFLFQQEGKVFLKNASDSWMFPIQEGQKIKHLVKKGRWVLSSQNIYILSTVPLQIGWKTVGPISSNSLNDLVLGTKLHSPLLGLVAELPHSDSKKLIFVDTVKKIAFTTPPEAGKKDGWFLGKESFGGCACWWVPEDHRVLTSSPHPITSIGNKEIELPKEVSPPLSQETYTGAGIADGFLHIRTARGDVYRRLADNTWQLIQVACSGDSEEKMFCSIAHATFENNFSPLALPLQLAPHKGMPGIGWFLPRTNQVVKAPVEAGPKAVLLGSSHKGEYHYVFGENKIFQVNETTCSDYGRASFALRKNNVLFLVVDFIADPPILDAEKLILLGSLQCRRWKLGEALHSYPFTIIEPCNGSPLSGVVDLRPLSLLDCGHWIEGNDIILGELSTGHLLIIRNTKSVASGNDCLEKLCFRFAESENDLSLKELKT